MNFHISGRDQTYADEIAQLTSEQEMPIEELRAMYKNIDNSLSTQENIDDNMDKRDCSMNNDLVFEEMCSEIPACKYILLLFTET